MALTAQTSAATSITSDGARMNGSYFQDNSSCCAPSSVPTCGVARRFYYGLSSPPTTLVNAGVACPDSQCAGFVSYNYTISGLLSDETYHFMANASAAGGGGCDSCAGGCGGQDNGSVLTFKTCAEAMDFDAPIAETPGEDSCVVKIQFDVNVSESSGSIEVEYKENSSGVWLSGGTISGLKTNAIRSFTLSGLVPSTLYDFRFQGTRNASCGGNSLTSSVGQFTTAASSIPIDLADTATAADLFTLDITGQARMADEELGYEEEVDVEILSTGDQSYEGVWFYHIPTRSYWFWNFDNFTAAVNDTDGDDVARLFVALGSEVYIADDEEYHFDDRNQNRPLADNTGSEMELSLVPKATDGNGGYFRLHSVDVKWSGTPTLGDILGYVDIDMTTEIYPKRPIPPDSRRVTSTRRVPLGPNHHGIDEWKRYALPRVHPSNVVGIRFSFPTGLVPKRTQPITIEKVRLNLVQAPVRRRRV